MNSFPPEVAQKLGCYVYRLIDPRNGETFYVGKGQGNRVFSHLNAESGIEGDELDNKLKRIRDIRVAGFDVSHVIHRHGMDEKTALEVESALIDAYPGLVNIVGGHGGNEFGVMHSKEIVQRYSQTPLVFKHKALMLSVNQSVEQTSLHEAVRYAWKVNLEKAQEAEVVLATRQGQVIGCFVAVKWLEATSENFPGKATIQGRYGFVGNEAPQEIKDLYMGKWVPADKQHGSGNPVRYSW